MDTKLERYISNNDVTTAFNSKTTLFMVMVCKWSQWFIRKMLRTKLMLMTVLKCKVGTTICTFVVSLGCDDIVKVIQDEVDHTKKFRNHFSSKSIYHNLEPTKWDLEALNTVLNVSDSSPITPSQTPWPGHTSRSSNTSS